MGIPEPGPPRTALRPWGEEPALSLPKGLDCQAWESTNLNQGSFSLFPALRNFPLFFAHYFLPLAHNPK
jgi:hypothetical protein